MKTSLLLGLVIPAFLLLFSVTYAKTIRRQQVDSDDSHDVLISGGKLREIVSAYNSHDSDNGHQVNLWAAGQSSELDERTSTKRVKNSDEYAPTVPALVQESQRRSGFARRGGYGGYGW